MCRVYFIVLLPVACDENRIALASLLALAAAWSAIAIHNNPGPR